MSNSRANQGTLAPNPMAEERARQTYDVDLAENTSRRGTNRAEEGLADDPGMHINFMTGIAHGYATGSTQNHNLRYQAKVAGGRGLRGRTDPAPSWAAVDRPTMAAFLQGGTVDERPVTPQPMMHQPRAGANVNTLAPVGHALDDGERPSAAYDVKFAGPNGGRRRNEATI
jgi:hypothetical protein